MAPITLAQMLIMRTSMSQTKYGSQQRCWNVIPVTLAIKVAPVAAKPIRAMFAKETPSCGGGGVDPRSPPPNPSAPSCDSAPHYVM